MSDRPEDTTLLLDGGRVTLAPFIGEWAAETTVRPAMARPDATEQLAELGWEETVVRGLTVEGALGEGGSAVVELARQLSLDRQVALKRLRDDAVGPEARLQLLREAWITGMIDHPNVVPVHDLVCDEQGLPQIVLKRIEGECWHDLLADDALVRQRFGVADALEWHVRVLAAVCSALEAAHEQGVLHRDVKPANVMIGRFGEPYLVDWGIAVALDERLDGRLPQVDVTEVLTGTPAYMAPELATLGARLDERTDVYLLGATLYQLLSGVTPHGTDRLGAVLERAVRSQPEPLPEADPELAALAMGAMARDPDERPQSARAFREALEDYLAHRSSRQLSRQADRQLEALLRALRDPDNQDVQRLYGACRFGYRRALEGWGDNREARLGLQEAVTAIVEHDLDAGRFGSALAHASELEQPPPALARRLVEAAEAHAAEAERLEGLEALARDVDPRRGGLARALAVAAMFLLWWGLPTLRDARGIPISYENTYLQSAVFLAASLVLARVWRAKWKDSAVSRALIGALVFAMVAQPVLDLAGQLAGLPFLVTRSLHPVSSFIVLGTLAMTVDLRIGLAALLYLVAVVVSALDPGQTPMAMDLANVGLVGVALWMARRDRR